MGTKKIGIIGAGPAALSVGAELAQKGHEIHIVAPEPYAAWVPNYGGWADQFDDDFGKSFFAQTYAAPCVRLPKEGKIQERVLAGKYVRIDKTKLQEHFLQILDKNQAVFINGMVEKVIHEKECDHVLLEDGQKITCDLIIDASGTNSPFTQTKGSSKPAFQLAYGQLVKTQPHGMRCGEMRFMDFSPATESEGIATFLYAMPLSHDTLFVEETILATRQLASFDYLKKCLGKRLEKEGIVVEGVLDEEYCRIPLGAAVPHKTQSLIPFGGAASMVHPASGYMLSKVLNLAPCLAELISEHEGSKEELLTQALEMIWPQERRRCRELYLVGLEILTRMTPQRNWEFFDAFFSLPDDHWRGFLDDTMTASELAFTMSKMFALSKSGLRMSLLQNSISHASGHLLKAAKPAWA